jgi:hypothetical protein
MPTPTIPAGNLFMNATLYTGTAATQSITNGALGASFQPDFIWIKSRSSTDYHQVFDSVRGISGSGSPSLITNLTDAEANYGPTFGVTAVNSTGFTVVGNGSFTNGSGINYVGWQWKAGGTAVTNNVGSLSAQVSANTTSGFSVVTYTGNGTAGATIGHGLGATPAMIMIKGRNATGDWQVYHQSIGNTGIVCLNLNIATFTTVLAWNNTSPTSSVFTLGSGGDLNGNTNTYVAYCWTPIAGFSQFGSYTGNGSADGPFVYTGFRPRFIMLKDYTNTGDNWILHDTARSPSNVVNLDLAANDSYADETFTALDILSNGFKLRNTNNNWNGSGRGYIYMAFAENPFKYANAR